MAYKGAVTIGSTVEAKLQLDPSASDEAFLVLGYGRSGGTPSGDGGVSAPGGSVRAEMALDAQGRLEVGVDTSTDSDTGQLMVRVNGQVRDQERIIGDTVWVYAIVPPAGGQS